MTDYVKLLTEFEDCWNVISELEDLSELADGLGENFAAAKLDRIIRDYDISFDRLFRKLEEHFSALDDGPLPETYSDEEASYDSEGNNNFSR
jgi:hypothetical protein|tara:strand:+ start:809 stop:1084 length:276 start_codon:yes stop_codon:yes gene_type:complete